MTTMTTMMLMISIYAYFLYHHLYGSWQHSLNLKCFSQPFHAALLQKVGKYWQKSGQTGLNMVKIKCNNPFSTSSTVVYTKSTLSLHGRTRKTIADKLFHFTFSLPGSDDHWITVRKPVYPYLHLFCCTYWRSLFHTLQRDFRISDFS